MSGTVRRADPYGAHAAGDQNPKPLTIALATIVGAWLIVYLLGSGTEAVAAHASFVTDDPAYVMSIVGP